MNKPPDIKDKIFKITSRKVTKLFTKDDLSIIREAVKQCHIIVSRTTLLIKIFCLEQLDQNKEIPLLTSDFIEVCMKIVQTGGSIKTRKGRGKRELKHDDPKKLATLKKQREKKEAHKLQSLGLTNQVLECYNRHFSKLNFNTKLSLSFILEALVTQIITSFTNNVEMRFQNYVGRYVLYHVLQLLGKTSAYRIGRKIRQVAGQITNFIMYEKAINKPCSDYITSNNLTIDYEALKNTLLPSNLKDIHLCQQKMVFINRLIETSFETITEGKRLFQPIPLSTTFIPCFIRLSTVGMTQLLFDKDRIDLFKLNYFDKYGIDLLNLTGKDCLCKTYKSLAGIEITSEYEEAIFATRLWQFICNFDNNNYNKIIEDKQIDGIWVFDNAIITNGTTAHFQITPKLGFRKSNFGKAKRTANDKIVEKIKKRKQSKADPFANLEFADLRKDEDMKALTHDFDDTLFLAADPGKGCLVDITDGVTHLKFTSRQRNKDTLQGVRIAAQNKKRKRFIVDINHELIDEPLNKYSMEEIETVFLSKYSSKSCLPSVFSNYLRRRNLIESEALKCYSKPLFRQNKFLVLSKTKSAEDKFLHKISKFHEAPQKDLPFWMTSKNEVLSKVMSNHQTRNNNRSIKLFYGNWGKSTNLKGSKPTPGIGLRRKIECFLKRMENPGSTVTVNEDYTSKTCPCCRHRSLEKAELPLTLCNEKHHLLRCTNVTCNSRWWNRDVAGSFNILYRGIGKVLESKGILKQYVDFLEEEIVPEQSETILAKKSRLFFKVLHRANSN